LVLVTLPLTRSIGRTVEPEPAEAVEARRIAAADITGEIQVPPASR
jgi:hypothetical protein